MTCVIPYCARDVPAVRDLLTWLRALGTYKAHGCLMVVDWAVAWDDARCLQEEAEDLFGTVQMAVNDQSVIGWPDGPNSLFATAAISANKLGQPWFWLEPDALPLRANFLDQLAEAYGKCGKRYMGVIVRCDQPNTPKVSLNGVAVYPGDCVRDLPKLLADPKRPWDTAGAEFVIPQAADTPLIQHFYGTREHAPTFVRERGPTSSNVTLALRDLRKDAVVFHRCKDGSLMRLLWPIFFPTSPNQFEFVLVLPYCNKDGQTQLKNIQWMGQMAGKVDVDCILSADLGIETQLKNQVEKLAHATFRSVIRCTYPVPPNHSWPQGANWAFQYTANFVHHSIGRPWLWLEADAVPVRPDWLSGLQAEYWRRHLPFYGPIVPGPGHMNGVGIYPENFPEVCPLAMQTREMAWDTVMKPAMVNLVADAAKTIQHCWGIVNGKPHPYGGEAASFRDAQSVRAWVLPTALVFHRCKDGSLIDRLREIRTLNPA